MPGPDNQQSLLHHKHGVAGVIFGGGIPRLNTALQPVLTYILLCAAWQEYDVYNYLEGLVNILSRGTDLHCGLLLRAELWPVASVRPLPGAEVPWRQSKPPVVAAPGAEHSPVSSGQS